MNLKRVGKFEPGAGGIGIGQVDPRAPLCFKLMEGLRQAIGLGCPGITMREGQQGLNPALDSG